MAESEKKSGISVGDLKNLIGEVVKSMTPASEEETDKKTEKSSSGTPSEKTPAGKTVAEQVRDALSGIKKEEEAAAREKRIDEQLAALSVANKEKTPVERGRLHRFMGWGENES